MDRLQRIKDDWISNGSDWKSWRTDQICLNIDRRVKARDRRETTKAIMSEWKADEKDFFKSFLEQSKRAFLALEVEFRPQVFRTRQDWKNPW